MKLLIKKLPKIPLSSPKCFAVFVDKNFKSENLKSFRKNIKIEEPKNLNRFFETEDKKFILRDINSTQKILFIKLPNKLDQLSVEKLGSSFFSFIKDNSIAEISLLQKIIKPSSISKENLLDHFFMGVLSKSYEFDIYKTKKINKKIFIFLEEDLIIEKINNKFNALNEGLILTKNLVSEPGNVLNPDEYVNRIKQLKKIGLKVSIFDKKKLKQLGMNALLGVGQGSIRGSYLAIIEWNGLKKTQKPLAFVGKGVCFDTGGISLKPAKFMEDMTYDMAGSAVVVGLMKTLALRKAKINAVGVVGLVENMPDGNAQRPGDIVKSYSGKTIEILNTDAEGRLVLADAITYTEKKYKPKFIVDLATLTGAIIVSLGSEYAGLFSNNDKISDQLFKAGEKVGEKVWRMPLNENYDKLINSKKADMQNINYVGGAGSITAAQFLQRFILNKTPWAHLDIAGMAFSKYGGALNSGGATGYGVRLLNQLIEDNYE